VLSTLRIVTATYCRPRGVLDLSDFSDFLIRANWAVKRVGASEEQRVVTIVSETTNKPPTESKKTSTNQYCFN
jgi:hypothetical protein